MPLLPDFSSTPSLCQLLLPINPSVRSTTGLVDLLVVAVVLSANGERVKLPFWIDAIQNRGCNKDTKPLISISTNSQAFGKVFGL